MPSLRGLPDNPVVLSVSADPEPVDSFLDVGSQCSVMIADAHGPTTAKAFEVQGRMVGVGLEEGKILVS
jgi:hypothetical protein